MDLARAEIFAQLQQDILQKEGFRSCPNPHMNRVLGPLEKTFPSGTFPLGVVHEFQPDQESLGSSRAATVGFISALAAPMLTGGRVMWWISMSQNIFPPALMGFGVKPDQVVFVNIRKARDLLWATEEALKCSAIAAVVAEVGRLDLTASRRLQLSAEQSKTTGFLIRSDLHPGITSSASRWRITSVPSDEIDGLPGLGYPQWKVELLRLRNGRPASWLIRYRRGRFESVSGNQDQKQGVFGVNESRRTG
jgi:protein ImuA